MVTVEGLEAALPRCSLNTTHNEKIPRISGNPLLYSQVDNFERALLLNKKQPRLSETYQPVICNIKGLPFNKSTGFNMSNDVTSGSLLWVSFLANDNSQFTTDVFFQA